MNGLNILRSRECSVSSGGYTCSFHLPKPQLGQHLLEVSASRTPPLRCSYTESPTASIRSGILDFPQSHRHQDHTSFPQTQQKPRCPTHISRLSESTEAKGWDLEELGPTLAMLLTGCETRAVSNSLGLIFITCVMRTFCVNYTLYFEIIIDLHGQANDTEGSHFTFSQFSP